jgi:PTH1 family peptidyl-tRNA hydrolase
MEDLHLIVGLGNPGAGYAKTRHNAGFMLVEWLGRRWRSDWKAEKKFQSRIAKAEVEGRRAVLCEPVGALIKFYQLPLKQLLVAMDDADLPLGEIRLRPSGSSGGHHGLESIEQHLSSREYARLRIGIGRKDSRREITGHVLGKLSAGEMAVIEKVLVRAADQVECWLAHGLPKAMSQFNGVIDDSNNEGKKQ